MKLVAKSLGLVLGVALLVGVAAVPASALTQEQASMLISMLGLTGDQAAAINALVTGASTAPASTSDACTLKNSPDLTIGSTGSNVIALQNILEANGYLTIPAGVSKGYFGSLTQQALAAWQADVPISPASGYFGPISRAALVCNPVVTPVTPVTPVDGDDNDSGLMGGEASLESFDIDSEDDVEEGQKDHVSTVTFDVEDGDVEINRVDIEFQFAGDIAEADDEPWDVFETITLVINGEEVAEEDIDDEDDWLDDDSPVFAYRLSGLDYVAPEGEEVEMEIHLTAQNNVDGADNGDASWQIRIADDGIRAVDSEDIQNYIPDNGASDWVDFDVEEAGADEEIKIKSSSNDPDSTTLEVDDNDESEWFEVFIFRLEAEENDIDLEEVTLTFDVSTSSFDNIVSDMKIEIDGEEVDDYDVTNGSTTSATVVFDVDKDVTIDADDTVDVVVMVEFKKQDGNYPVGTDIQVGVTEVTGEGVDNVEDTSSLVGEEHTLALAVAGVTADSNVDKAEDDASGVISWTIMIDASDSDEDVEFSVADNNDVNGATDEIEFEITGPNIAIATAGLTLIDGDATYSTSTNKWTVAEGEEAEFALDVQFTTATSTDNGTYRVKLEKVAGITVDETSAGMTLSN